MNRSFQEREIFVRDFGAWSILWRPISTRELVSGFAKPRERGRTGKDEGDNEDLK
jgi:hypothetical protein